MSEVHTKDDATRDVVKEMAMPSKSLRGPFILAKMVIDALENQKQGDENDYGAIIGHLSVVQMKPVVMQRWLQALNLCVSQLTKEYDLLVGATLRMTWYNKEPEIVQLYIEYLTNLISAQTCYLRSTLLGVVKLLWLPASEGECVYRNVHEAIHAVLKLVPSAPSVLMPLLRKNYPFKGRNSEMQELAIRNVFHITTYCPTLRDDILELVIHQMLSIDVEVPQLAGDDEHDLCTPGDTQFHVELETSAGTGGEKAGSVPESDNCLTAVLCQRQIMSNESAEKLDIMMNITFQYLEAQCFQNGMFVFDEAVRLLRSLFKIFERVVLPTHACSHVQFLLFRLTSLHGSFPGIFLDFLWDKFQDPNTSMVLRQTAAAYIASYVARANFVPLHIVNLCLNITTQWIHRYIDNCSPENMKPDVKQHGPFFVLCQAVFYIFVFRHKELIDMEGGGSFLRKLNFERIILSRLNPLKVCLPSVVDVFASLTNRYEIVFCYTILEQNKRLILSMGAPTAVSHDSGTAAKLSQPNVLDCFFPFDPYYLKRSSKFVHSLYQVWDEGDDMVDGENDDHSSVASSSLQSESFYGSHSFNMDSQSMPSFSVSPPH